MTGPEHYREAEQLLGARRSGETAEDAASRLAEARIHATLALAAATALARSGDDEVHRAWQDAAGEQSTRTMRDPREEYEDWERNMPPGGTRSLPPSSYTPQPAPYDPHRGRPLDPDTDV